MNTADYALIISLGSFSIALAGFVWSVWQKFIYPKASVKVRFWVCCIISGNGDGPPWPRYVCLTGTNHGPTDVIINTVTITILNKWPWKQPQYGVVNPIRDLSRPEMDSWPVAGGLPRMVKVGESHSLFFPYDHCSFARARLGRVSLSDNFDRLHSARKIELRSVKKSLDRAFPDQPYQEPPSPQAEA